MSQKKGFVIAWFYPPGNSSEGIVAYKLFSHSAHNYDIWTRDNQHQNLWDRSPVEAELCSKNVRLLPSPAGNEQEWAKNAVAYFSEHADEYDFIMSRSEVAEAHYAAYLIHQKFPNTKWIASFGDPLINNPYLKLDYPKRQEFRQNPHLLVNHIANNHPGLVRSAKAAISPLRRKYKKEWDAELLRSRDSHNQYILRLKRINTLTIQNADCCIFNNKYEKDLSYPQKFKKCKKRSIILPHSYSKEFYPKTTKRDKNKKLIFSYTGHLDATRNIHTLLQALQMLKTQDSKLSQRIIFNFYGHLDESDLDLIQKYHLTKNVKTHPDVSYLESLKIIKNSNFALLVDADFGPKMKQTFFFPAKLVDYIGAETNVFAISSEKGPTADVLNEVKGGIIVSHSKDEICSRLSDIIYKSFRPPKYNQLQRRKYETKNVVKLLDDKINQL